VGAIGASVSGASSRAHSRQRRVNTSRSARDRTQSRRISDWSVASSRPTRRQRRPSYWHLRETSRRRALICAPSAPPNHADAAQCVSKTLNIRDFAGLSELAALLGHLSNSVRGAGARVDAPARGDSRSVDGVVLSSRTSRPTRKELRGGWRPNDTVTILRGAIGKSCQRVTGESLPDCALHALAQMRIGDDPAHQAYVPSGAIAATNRYPVPRRWLSRFHAVSWGLSAGGLLMFSGWLAYATLDEVRRGARVLPQPRPR